LPIADCRLAITNHPHSDQIGNRQSEIANGFLSSLLISPVELLNYEHTGGEELALVIYTKPGCPYCQQARDHYDSQGIPYLDYDAQNDRARRAEMFSYSGGDPTVPCIVQDGKFVGSGWGDPPRG
jgi:glutaredoxin 3